MEPIVETGGDDVEEKALKTNDDDSSGALPVGVATALPDQHVSPRSPSRGLKDSEHEAGEAVTRDHEGGCQLHETMNGDASAGPAALPMIKATAESDDDNVQEDDGLLMPDDEVERVCIGQSRSVLPMSGNLCGIQVAREFIGGTTGPRTLALADDLGPAEEAPPDDEMEHTAPLPAAECLRTSLSAVGCKDRFKIDLESAVPCPIRPLAARGLHDPRDQRSKAEAADDNFMSPCPGLKGKDDNGDKGLEGDSRASPRPNKRRTWKYYPPPQNDTDAVPIDVIDHESEVLIIRREPPPPPKGTCNITASSFCQS